ncbi:MULTISPECIES: 4'-phosphopantetheinyl transferase family protein [Prochlorococcus]|uniref:4'-phosphopantetheinyl transferase family protein n=1 Tax=Prochlorococcus TaxID=1218 RepID=UPI000533BC5F|nr:MULTISPECIES: hypothetical protein [Prochlorococcus]KGG13303.1 putative 4'-phosphopantetheinyl transferase family protein [Prochlorococcus sp. MIT 0601]
MQTTEVLNSRVLPLWLFKRNGPLKQITPEEERIATGLSKRRAREYRHSRGNVRSALSELLGIEPLDIPMKATPGKAPHLEQGLGYISFSHCSDALLLGWCQEKLGVDLERTDRTFKFNALANRFFSKKSQSINIYKDNTRLNILEEWIVKEAAIKWQEGKLIEGLKYWNWNKSTNMVNNDLTKTQLKIHKFDYKLWSISIAISKSKIKYYPIICTI